MHITETNLKHYIIFKTMSTKGHTLFTFSIVTWWAFRRTICDRLIKIISWIIWSWCDGCVWTANDVGVLEC